MSYPTNDNSGWEPTPRRPSEGTIVLPPRRRSIVRDEEGDGEDAEEKPDPPLERWHQVQKLGGVIHGRPWHMLQSVHAIHSS